MAAASLIVLSSSPPASYQLPPNTPPSAQHQPGILISSSPGLVSPSKFVKPRASGLKSGSRAQQVPDGVQVGFASASTLWEVGQLGREKEQHESKVEQQAREQRLVEQSKESRGKLAKPKKAAMKLKVVDSRPEKGVDEYACVATDVVKPKKSKTKTLSNITQDGTESSNRTNKAVRRSKVQRRVPEKQALEEFAYVDPGVPKPMQSKEKTVGKPSQNVAVASAHELVQIVTVNLSEYASDTSAQRTGLKDAVEGMIPKQKKCRKSAAKTNHDPVKAPSKKPRKRKMKSESIILNSDDPQDINEPTMASNYFSPTRPQDTELERSLAKSKADSVTLSDAETGLPEVKPSKTSGGQYDQLKHEKECPPNMASEQSNYFSIAAASCMSKDETTHAETPIGEHEDLPAAPLPMPSKRRKWTPVKDSVSIYNEQRPLAADSESSEPKRQLADIIGGYGYVSNELGTQTVPRTTTGEAVTKRVRIELGARVVPGNGTRIEESAVIPSPPKPAKQKKGRKKAQTITALATAAFQPPKDRETDEGTISNFFSPGKVCANEQAAKPEQLKTKVTRPQNPQKPKEKSTTEARDGSTKQKKPAKAKQTKVKFNEADYRSKLYSPGRATAQLQGQDFLFGTSSQLAMDKPASFIRAVQAAIPQSELYAGRNVDGAPVSSQAPFSQSQQTPKGKSCIRVPTAPHGTCLSIEQARRDLWSVPSRDSEGAIFKTVEPMVAEPSDMAENEMACHEIAHADPMHEQNAEESGNIDDLAPKMDPRNAVVDLCDTSLIAVPQAVQTAGTSFEPHTLQEDAVEDASSPLVVQDAKDPDDWMLLGSSSPLPATQSRATGFQPPGNLRGPQGSGDSVSLSPRRFRPPLSPLNPNAVMLNVWSPSKVITSGQVRPLSSSTADQARQSRPRSPIGSGRGRPRKDAAIDDFSSSPAKRRSRPTKLKTLASEPPQLLKPKKQTAGISASQPTSRGWIDIDDIYDSDSPTTPSPPRRRATSSPPAVRPLTLSPSIQVKAPSLAASTLTSKDTSWVSIRTDLFERITAVVKSAPPSNDGNKPSWYEKILLYDPIVLEDITAWLNEQGLRVESRRHKPRAKKRGRKRKDAELDVEEVEWEVREEPLQAWMVQKWCQEKSICCLWKEGLRGGVRTGY